MSTLTFSEEDLLFDLDLRVMPVDATGGLDADAMSDPAPVHTTYGSETCTRGTCGSCNYGCSYTCRSRAGAKGAGMCI